MDVESVTIGLPVTDLEEAVAWYRRALELGEVELAPADGVVELRLGPVWLQLGVGPVERSGAEAVVRLGVADAAGEHARLRGLAVDVDDLEHVPGVVSYFDLRDPWGNVLSLYSEA